MWVIGFAPCIGTSACRQLDRRASCGRRTVAFAKIGVDATVLSGLTGEIRDRAVPSRVEVASQRDGSRVTLGLRTELGRLWLDLSWSTDTGRVCLTSRGPPKGRKEDEKNFALGALLRSSIVGMAMVDCRLAAPLERIVQLDFAERVGADAQVSVFVELLGAGRSNLVVVDSATGEIKGCGRQVSAKKAIRALQTGGSYSVPPAPPSELPDPAEDEDAFADRLRSLTGEKSSRALVRTYRGMSPAVAKNMFEGAEVDPDTAAEALTTDEVSRLYRIFGQWTRAVSGDHSLFNPVARSGEKGVVVDMLGLDQPAVETTASELVDGLCRAEEERMEVGGLKTQCTNKLAGLLSRWRTKADLFTSQTEGTEEADRLREEGDLIMAFAHTWEEGDDSVEVETIQGERRTIAVAEGQSAIAAAQSRHKQAQKRRRAVEKVKPLLEEALGKVDYYENLLYQVESLDRGDLQLLREVREDVDRAVATEKGIRVKASAGGGRGGGGKKKGAKAVVDSGVERIAVPGNQGVFLLVGKNSRQNDLITFELSRKDDLWFHAAGLPGGHVVLQADTSSSIGEQDLQFAADVAAFFSRGRRQTTQSVIYTRVKNLKRNGAPGGVRMEKEKFIEARPDRAAASLEDPVGLRS